MEKRVVITNEDVMRNIIVMEKLFGSRRVPKFEGKLVVANPTPEEFAKHDENFKACYEAGDADGVENGVIYYDEGLKRCLWVEEDDVEIVE